MAPQRWARLEILFARAIALTAEQSSGRSVGQLAAARERFLQDACGDDAPLLHELRALLRAHDGSGPLDSSAVSPGRRDSSAVSPGRRDSSAVSASGDSSAVSASGDSSAGPSSYAATTPSPQSSSAAFPLPQSLATGTCLGAWRVAELLGRGGSGEVYAGVRVDASFAQRVAIKLLRADAMMQCDTAAQSDAVAQLERFHAERRILAKLEHIGIARLLDGGVAPDGRPFTVIEFVQGVSLRDYCRARRSPLSERLALFLQICDAVAFAHQNLVVHRDLKPDNILVNAQGRIKLLDFGIAKLLDSSVLNCDAELTRAPFTPDYAAPEQLSGQAITTATDVYALGVVLFELLTDSKPLSLNHLPPLLALKLLLQRPPVLPSRAAHTASVKNLSPPVPARMLRGDLDAIVAKCLRKQAAHRFATVNALAQDLQHYLRHEPVQARSGAQLYAAGLFLRRNWLAMGAAAALILVLSAAALYANQARLRTEAALARADTVKAFLINLFQQNNPAAGNARALSARALVDIGSRQIETGFSGDIDTQIELLGVSGTLYQSLGEVQRSGDLFAKRLELALRAYPLSDARVIAAQLDRGVAARIAEQFALADTLLHQALRSASGDNANQLAPLRMRILLALGQLASARANERQAMAWADQAIVLSLAEQATRRKRPTPGQDAKLMPAADITRAYADRGRYTFRAGQIAAAEAPLRAALAGLNPNDPADLPMRLEVIELLGMVLTSLGRFDEALPLLRTNVAQTRALLGELHPSVADALHQLASALRQSGDSDAAIPVFQEALRLYEHNYGPTHSFVATTLTGLGQTLSAQGQHRQAIAALMRAYSINLKSLGAAHIHTAISVIALADAHFEAGDFAAAEAGFRAALLNFASIGDGRHIYGEAARLGLGKTLSERHQYQQAQAALRQAHTRLAAQFGATDRRAIEAAMSLVHCLLQSGKHQQAQAVFDASATALAQAKPTSESALVRAARLELERH